tara:strand:- start:25 stop:387 length:363 start_codon:yes stop_codon:yes gene_type:complete
MLMDDWIDYVAVGMMIADRKIADELEGLRSTTADAMMECIKKEDRKEFLRLCKIAPRDLPVKDAVLRECSLKFLEKEVKRLSFLIRNAVACGIESEHSYIEQLQNVSSKLESLTSDKAPA